MKISVVIPIYNENLQSLKTILVQLKKIVSEIILVDDGSTLQENYYVSLIQAPQIIYLRHQINRGQGAALQTGTDYAVHHQADIIVHFDGDGQHQPSDVLKLIQPILNHQADFVFGSRFLSKKKYLPWSKQYIILPIAKLINYFLTGLKLTDAHNGLRAFRACLADKLYLTQDRMAHASEYLYLVKKNQIKFTEVGVEIIYKNYGQGISGGIKILKDLFVNKLTK